MCVLSAGVAAVVIMEREAEKMWILLLYAREPLCFIYFVYVWIKSRLARKLKIGAVLV